MPAASVKGRLLPFTSVEMTTEPFGAGPLNTAAVMPSGRPGSGSGLSIASRSSGDAELAVVDLFSGALPRGAT